MTNYQKHTDLLTDQALEAELLSLITPNRKARRARDLEAALLRNRLRTLDARIVQLMRS